MYICGKDAEAVHYEAYLDGERVKNCYSANIEQGWVEVFSDPPIIWDYFKNENVPNLKKIKGRVELVNKETGKVFR